MNADLKDQKLILFILKTCVPFFSSKTSEVFSAFAISVLKN